MRPLLAPCLVLGLIAGPAAHADEEPPILRFELQVAPGITMAPDAVRALSLSIGASGEHAFMAQPWTSVYGSIFVVGPEKFDVGGVAGGLRVRLGSGVRLSGGGTALVAPSTKVGATVAMGGCFRESGPSLCVDLEGTVLFFGGGLQKGGEGQVNVVFGLGFDVL